MTEPAARPPVNPRAGDSDSLKSPRTGERCLICGALEPSSHATVRLGNNLHWAVVCASHTIREVVLSHVVFPTLEVGEQTEASGYRDPLRDLYAAAVAWYQTPTPETQDRLRAAVEHAWEYPLADEPAGG